MKKLTVVILLASAILFAGSNPPAEAWGSAAHVYIAQRALFTLSPNALYGATAPDILGYVDPGLGSWVVDNHAYYDLLPFADRLPEMMFSMGWMTHNERWGGDYYAHIAPAYAWVKGDQLLSMLEQQGMVPLLGPQPRLMTHIAVEIAVDMLLKKQDPLLGVKLYEAAALRSPRIPAFLNSSGAIPLGPQGIVYAEGMFRDVTMNYGMALAAPNGLEAMALFVSQVAGEIYGANVSPEQAAGVLQAAMALCQPDYLPVITMEIRKIQARVWRFNF
jgi:hypothetical protein